MDYNTLKKCFGSYIKNDGASLDAARKELDAVKTADPFDKRVITVLKNITKTFEIAEYFKTVTNEIFNNSDFFSDNSIHQTAKAQRLKEILANNNFVESNRQFNLSILQTYVENVLSKQLLEINIKIEENQRILHNLESAKQPSRKAPKPAPKPAPAPKKNKKTADYLIVDNERTRCAIRYDTVIELLRISKRTADKYLSEQVIPYGKLTGLNSRNVLRKIINFSIPKNQPLYNISYKMKNSMDKQMAVITRKENRLSIIFVDAVLSGEPVEAQDMGDFVKSFEGNFKVLEV